MRSRKELHNKKSITKQLRLLVGAIVLTVLIGGSLNVAFADQDISSILSNWFDQNRTESIAEIDRAITEEQAIQTQRLKGELQAEIEHAKKQLNSFTETEKHKSIEELQAYADALIQTINVDDENEKHSITTEYQAILRDAKEKMAKVRNAEEPSQADSKAENDHEEDAQVEKDQDSSKQQDRDDQEEGREK